MQTHIYKSTPGQWMIKYLSFLLLLTLLTSACGGAETGENALEGPQAWVEFPYNDSTLPMAPVTLVVYAADPAGISYIHIKVNGQSLPAYAASPITMDGSSRLVRIDYAWQPPGEGEYVVEAAGVNNAGASGGFGSTRFCIGTCQTGSMSAPVPSDTSTPAPGDTPTLTPTVADTPSQTPFPGTTIQFWATPPYINAGSCATLNWNVTGAQEVSLGGTPVNASSSQQVCLCKTTSYTLSVRGVDGQTQSQGLTVDVSGSCTTPTKTITPTKVVPPTVITPPTEYVPPADTSGPTVNAVYAVWEGCTIYGQADISDPSGVSWAEFWFDLNGQGWAWIKMNESGGLWESQVGVSVSDGMNTPTGSLVYKVRTLDTLNNESWSGESTLDYLGCGGTQ